MLNVALARFRLDAHVRADIARVATHSKELATEECSEAWGDEAGMPTLRGMFIPQA